MTIFGPIPTSKLFLPKSTADWGIKGMLKKGDCGNIALLSFYASDSETIDIRKCFQDVNHIFAFGRDISKSVVTVEFIYFYGKECSKSSNTGSTLSIDNIRKKYEENRIYKKKQTLSVTIDNFNFSGYLIDMKFGQVDPKTSTCGITFTFIVDQEM